MDSFAISYNIKNFGYYLKRATKCIRASIPWRKAHFLHFLSVPKEALIMISSLGKL